MPVFNPLNLKQWIDDHRHELKPPVNNQMIWRDQDLIIMMVGGPNQRLDYHINDTQEFFYQLEGTLHLKVVNDNQFEIITLNAGDVFLLPANVPHSPQREANSIGMVVETKRLPGVLDGFQWYCEPCGLKLYETFVTLTDIVKQMPPIFDKFYNTPANCICPQCDTHYTRP